MIAVLQRTSNASVSVKDKIIGQIKHGVVVLLGVKRGDSYKESEYLAHKVSKLRIFNDKQNKMNLSLGDISGSVLVDLRRRFLQAVTGLVVQAFHQAFLQDQIYK